MFKARTMVLAAFLFALVLGGCASSGEASGSPEPLAPPAFSAVESAGAPEQEAAPEPSEVAVQEARVYLNGNRLELTNTAYVRDGDVMVPLAEVLSYFSRTVTVTADGEALTANDADMGVTVVVTAGSAEVQSGQVSYAFERLPESADGDIFVEAGSFSALFDTQVSYSDDGSIAYITESGLC